MGKKSQIDWGKVDWTKEDEEIAEQTGCALNTVKKRRKEFEEGESRKESRITCRLETQLREALDYQVCFLGITLSRLMKMVMLTYLRDFPVTYTYEESGLRKMLQSNFDKDLSHFQKYKNKLQEEILLRADGRGWKKAVEKEEERLRPLGLDQESRQRKKEEEDRQAEEAKRARQKSAHRNNDEKEWQDDF